MKVRDASVLIIDDDEDVLFSAKMLLKDYYKKIKTVSDPGGIPFLLNKEHFDIVLLDMNYSGSETSGKEGIRWLKQIKKTDPLAVVVMMTAFATLDLAVEAVKTGATDFVVKPWQNQKLLATLSAAYDLKISRQEVEKLRNTQKIYAEDNNKRFGEFIGESLCMKELYRVIGKTAATEANILILGENGTGKELVARSIHSQSLRAGKPLITVDLGSIHENLFESELFGHVKGAYTDAREDRQGRFEVASGGTLFFDEIGNLPLTLQAKLLTAIQNRQIVKMGSNKVIPVDIRLICATNLPIYEKIDSGEFRDDLLYRIKTVEINVPPLRERDGDVGLLAKHFVGVYCKKYRKPLMKISPDGVKSLEHYHWPGNVRELQHVMERAVIMSDGRILKAEDFILNAHSKKRSNSENMNLEQLKINTICRALEKNQGNISRAAKDLGLTRAALYRRIEKYGIG